MASTVKGKILDHFSEAIERSALSSWRLSFFLVLSQKSLFTEQMNGKITVERCVAGMTLAYSHLHPPQQSRRVATMWFL